MYGQGIHANNPQEAGKLSGAFYKDPSLFRVRSQAALAELLKQPGVDPERIGAIGFCFGGATVLELARSGANVKGVVTFHGSLKTAAPARPGDIKASEIVVLHGSRDPLVPPADVAGFMDEMNAAKVPFRLVAYPDAVHAFTNPEAGSDPAKPTAYNPSAAEAAYGEMTAFFAPRTHSTWPASRREVGVAAPGHGGHHARRRLALDQPDRAVGLVAEHHPSAPGHVGAAAILVHARGDVERGGGDVGDAASRVAPHQHGAATLGRAALQPVERARIRGEGTQPDRLSRHQLGGHRRLPGAEGASSGRARPPQAAAG